MRCSILIVDLDKSNLGELLDIQHDQVRNGEIPAFGCACAGEKDMRNAIANFQAAVARESVIERDPAKRKSFRRAGTFEIFI